MTDFVKTWSFLLVPVATLLVTLIGSWAVIGTRLANVEGRQDRQATTIMALQVQINSIATNFAGLQAKVDAIDNNVDYIRSRIDRVTQ